MSQPATVHELRPALHLVVVHTATGAVTFWTTRHPTEQLIHANQELVVDRRMIVQSARAERIEAALREEFADKQLATEGRPSYLVDWEKVVDTVGEFDFATGRRLERDGVKVGDTVQVQMGLMEQPRSRGEVMAISEKRYLVKLERRIGDMEAGWFTRLLIKPVVRVPALVGAA